MITLFGPHISLCDVLIKILLFPLILLTASSTLIDDVAYYA